MVHVMVDRARVFKSSELLDEKMASLGRLAAGLAHEMNNPASAVARSAKTLVAELAGHDETTRRFCLLKLTDELRRELDRLRLKLVGAEPPKSALEVADRQDNIDTWLADHGVTNVDVRPLVEAGFDDNDLENLHSKCGNDQDFTILLAYVSSEQAIRQLVGEIDMAASRIHSLVAAVKGFTYVNQQATLQPIAIGRGLSDTVTVLRSKARQQSVDVAIHVPEDLPAVDGYGGELNQVWANLLDNAIDATPGGHIKLEAISSDSKVVVSVIDDGPGIPPDVANRIFDPFFTTKGVGKGTGLGLDIARRIVQRHHGTLDMSTGPNGTEFRVTLPVSSAGSKL
jgi:signal transduction histidine kinase